MNTNKPDSQQLLRLIDDLGAEAAHTDGESREALQESGLDPDAFARAVRTNVRGIVEAADAPAPGDSRRSTFDTRARTFARALVAASAAFFVVSFHLNYRAGIDAQRETARAQMIGPLLPALSSDDPERRSLALVVVRQVDPGFAAATATQLATWEVNSQAQARARRNATYASRILAGIQKLQLSRDPDDRKAAIWNDLLPVLLEARRNRDDFVDVAIEYQRVLPLLHVRDPEVFLDSYWGELWILNILLESKIVPVVEAARAASPEPAIVQQVYQRNAASLADRDRRAFEEAVSVYANALKGFR